MALAACLITNEPPGLKEMLLQARIDGKSWKQIADEFDYGSPGQARTAFKKQTGLTDFKIKGKQLSNLIEEVGKDNLAKMAPPKVNKAAEQAFGYADDAAKKGAAQWEADVPAVKGQSDEVFSNVWKDAFGNDKPVFTGGFNEASNYADAHQYYMKEKAYQRVLDLKKKYGTEKLKQIEQALSQGKYYGDIHNTLGVDFADIDAINWQKLVTQNKGDVWKAYKAKPTSEYGFKEVQDLVWDLKKHGMSQKDIAKYFDIDPGVVNLILKNTWSLPSKGSSSFVTSTIGSPKPYSPAGSYTQAVKEALGKIGGEYPKMTKEFADEWVNILSTDLDERAFLALKKYTGSYYEQINDSLRGLRSITPQIRLDVDAVQASMRPIPKAVQVRRGVDANAFPGGVPGVGDVYTDAGFMSTSYGDSAAFSSSKAFELVLDLPEGFKARPLHQLSSFKSEREILLGRDSQFIVTGIEDLGRGKTRIYMKARVT